MEPTYSLDVSAHGTSAQCVELAWSCMKYSSLLEGRELQIVRRRAATTMRIRARERSVFLFQVLTRPARGFVYYIKDRGYRVSQRPPSPELVRSPEPRDRCVVRVPDVRVGRLRSWARSRRRSGRLGSCGARVGVARVVARVSLPAPRNAHQNATRQVDRS